MELHTYSHRCHDNDLQSDKIVNVSSALRKIRRSDRVCTPKSVRKAIVSELRLQGWSSQVRLAHGSNITITAISGDLGLCLQTGNMSRMYADLLKLQYLYTKGVIGSGVYIVPTREMACEMGSNLAHFERLTAELSIFFEIITIPLHVIGLS